ncbi:MAG: hypothetical protein SFX74_07870 [Fimbriimonadaceae bacterium]|nr:hypothetical protein [Fimbriimonadaceae bacterium]
MQRFRCGLLALLAVTLAACGGGGGGSNGTTTKVPLAGRVLDVVSTGALNPAATVAAGGGTDSTDLTDGSFSFDVNRGTTAVTVTPTGTSYGTFTFTFPAINDSTDVGDLYVGPNRVTVRGTVRDAATNDPIANAQLAFAGRTAVTNAAGQFSLTEVAYANSTQAGFWGIIGAARATGYFATEFSANGKTATSGVVTVDDVLLAPDNDLPPGVPYNVYGRVTGGTTVEGAVVQLRQGGTTVRQFTVGANGQYQFWVPRGTYEVRATRGPQSGGPFSVALPQSNSIVRRDIPLG